MIIEGREDIGPAFQTVDPHEIANSAESVA